MLLQEMKEGVSKRVIIRNDKAMKERLTRNYIPVDAVQLRTMLLTYEVDSMSNWRRRGSFSLPPFQGAQHLMSSVSFVTRLKSTSSTATSIPTKSSSATGPMEKVEEGTPG
jgi:hypothetical protein